MQNLFSENSDLFGRMIEAAPNAMIMVNQEGQIVFVNAVAEKLFGYDRSELHGNPIEALLPERFRTFHPEQRQSFLANPQTRSMGAGRELFGRRKDASEMPIEIGLNPINAQGELFVLASIIEITERKRAEERFRQVVDASPSAMIMVDSSGLIVLVNLQAEKLFNYSREELLNRKIEDLVPQRFRNDHPEKRGEFFSNPTTRAMGTGRDLYGLRKDGTEVPIEIGLNPMQTNEGSFVLASIIDITERKKNESLIAAREAALEASRMKSQFLANMSHEIRTPLNGIVGMTGLLLDSTLDQEQKEFAENIRISADALFTVINDVLDFSKIEAGKLDLENIVFDLNELIEDTFKIFSFSAKSKGINLALFMPPFTHYFRGDPSRVRQIFTNLLNNAIKFTDTGSILVTVTQLSDDGPRIKMRFEIKDTGIGISPRSLERLFQVFSQADETTTRRFGGTGLGLSICKSLVDLMGGQIGVTSVEGNGSTFWFELNFEKSLDGLISVDDEPTSMANPASHGKRILVAEDNQINQKVILKLLEKMGFSANVVANGNEAIEALCHIPYDLVLMDCQMPEMDGYDTTKMIRRSSHLLKCTPDIPVIAMTANVLKGTREKCLEAGMNDYLSKPVKTKMLEEALTKWLYPNENPSLSTVNRFVELENDYGPDFVVELLEVYLDTTPLALDKMSEDLSHADFHALAAEAHSLKSGSSQLGLHKITELCSQLEIAANSSPTDEINQQFMRLSAEVKKSLNALEVEIRQRRK